MLQTLSQNSTLTSPGMFAWSKEGRERARYAACSVLTASLLYILLFHTPCSPSKLRLSPQALPTLPSLYCSHRTRLPKSSAPWRSAWRPFPQESSPPSSASAEPGNLGNDRWREETGQLWERAGPPRLPKFSLPFPFQQCWEAKLCGWESGPTVHTNAGPWRLRGRNWGSEVEAERGIPPSSPLSIKDTPFSQGAQVISAGTPLGAVGPESSMRAGCPGRACPTKVPFSS